MQLFFYILFAHSTFSGWQKCLFVGFGLVGRLRYFDILAAGKRTSTTQFPVKSIVDWNNFISVSSIFFFPATVWSCRFDSVLAKVRTWPRANCPTKCILFSSLYEMNRMMKKRLCAYYTHTHKYSPHWYSSDVVESENDQHVVNFPSYPEALLVRHLKIE